jgi:lipopolysaccharide transport protein LptA
METARMSWKDVLRKIAALVLLLALGYALYNSGVGEWVRQKVLKQRPEEEFPSQNDLAGGTDTDDAGEGAEDVKFTVKEFSREMRGEKSGEVEARVAGEKAVRQRENLYRIFSPVVTSLVEEKNGDDDVDVQMDQVRLTAERAVFDESRSEVELQDSVTARGEDFRITTQSVTYNAAAQKVSGSKLVRMERYRVEPDGAKNLSMVVTGKGLKGDLILRTVTVLSSVEASLLRVSEDFMASGQPGDTEEPQKSQKIIIRSEGPMTYRDGTRQVIFEENVRVSTGGKILRAERLEVNLDKNEDRGRLSVTGMTATTNVRLKFRDQVATGEELVWQNVTQAGVLTGDPARLESSRFSVSGGKLTFVRLDNRLQVNGPGQLVKKASKTVENTKDEESTNHVLLTGNAPIKVTWAGGMTYEASGPRARFEKDVKAVQGESSLSCQNLDLEFDADNQLQKVQGRRNVSVREQQDGSERRMRCDQVIWEAQEGVVRMKALEDEQVVVQSGQEKLFSPVVHYVPETNRFECPAAGRLKLSGRSEAEGNPGRQPMEVTWQESMSYERSGEPKAVFRGDVKVHQPERNLSAQTLRVLFNENRKPVRIVGEKQAVLEVRRGQNADGEGEGAGGETNQSSTDWRLEADRIEGLLPDDQLEATGAGELQVLRENDEVDWIRWEDRMHADFAASYARFTGNVRARFGGSHLESATLRLDFNEDRELRHVNCKQDVTFRSGGERSWTLQSNSAEAIFAPGSVLSQIIARDDVLVEDANRRLRSQFLTLFFRRQKGAEQQSLSRAVARKNVRVRYTSDTDLKAFCERLDWNAETDRYRLTGDPAQLAQEDMQIDGETIIIDRRSGRVSLPGGGAPGRTAIEEKAD